MSKISDDLINRFDPAAWFARTKDLKGYVAVEGVLLSHLDPSKVYFATVASGNSVRFEMSKDDIGDVTPMSEPVALFGHSYKGVRLLLQLNALVSRISLHEASGLVEYPQGTLQTVDGAEIPLRNTMVGGALMR